ncbi:MULTISPECIES: hypothetical protein [Haloprofundus]|uniref:hypothetical protein n=1 Tax=Haloprofundus TaxID=1911573 RepID=UPI000E435AFD|nr:MULTISPECIES: hypothetical protein [Haloprofundus]
MEAERRHHAHVRVLRDVTPSLTGASTPTTFPTERRRLDVRCTIPTAREDVVRSYDLHANANSVKLVVSEEFVDLARAFEEFWSRLVELPLPNRN